MKKSPYLHLWLPILIFGTITPSTADTQISPHELADPGTAENQTSNTPLQAVWQHALKQMSGNPKTEVLKETPSRLEVSIQRGKQTFIYVFDLESIRGSKAIVHAGLKDAGVDTIYHLTKTGDTWSVTSVEETGF